MNQKTLDELSDLLKYDPPHAWRGGAVELIDSREREVILSGPSETGKTYAACYKAHMNCREHPKTQGALVRKVAASIPGTVLVTMKRIIGDFPVNYFGGLNNPERIIYPNGSQIWIGGMDNPTKVLSGERDFIQVCQAEELSLNDWEIMTTRTTGRGAIMPYTQVFGDCNPGGAKHFLRSRKEIRLLISHHKDNPTLYDNEGNITAQGAKTMQTLESLTGVRRKRLLEGIWATAEGAVYDMFDAAIHMRTYDAKNYKNFRLNVDEGYTNPAVILICGEDNDGRRHYFREFYRRGVLQSEVVKKCVEWCREFDTVDVIVDASANGLIADLRDNGLNAKGGKGSVLYGIQCVQNDLQVASDGRPRITFDPSMENTQNDFESYEWKPEKDAPRKENDHAPDAVRYDYDAMSKDAGSFGDNPFADYRG